MTLWLLTKHNMTIRCKLPQFPAHALTNRLLSATPLDAFPSVQDGASVQNWSLCLDSKREKARITFLAFSSALFVSPSPLASSLSYPHSPLTGLGHTLVLFLARSQQNSLKEFNEESVCKAMIRLQANYKHCRHAGLRGMRIKQLLEPHPPPKKELSG